MLIEKNKAVEVSRHAENRLRERSGINKKSVERLAERAYYSGIKHSQTKGRLFKYISSIAIKSDKGTNIRIFGDKLFVFNNKGINKVVLVTVLQVPSNLTRNINSYVKVKKRRE